MSESKSAASRANGAKSHGPVTPEGKATSARNSLRHGLTSKAVVLPSESQEGYEALLESYVRRFQPADAVEMDLVESMAASRWRLRRIVGIETQLLAGGIKLAGGSRQPLGYAFRDREESLTALTRYENSLNRSFDRALKQLQLLQQARPLPPPEDLQNEPEPAPAGAAESGADSPSAPDPLLGPLASPQTSLSQPIYNQDSV